MKMYVLWIMVTQTGARDVSVKNEDFMCWIEELLIFYYLNIFSLQNQNITLPFFVAYVHDYWAS